MMKRSFLASLSAIALLAGCPSSPDPGDACARYARSAVDYIRRCFPQIMHASEHTRERAEILCQQALRLEGLRDGAKQIEDCAAGYERAACGERVPSCEAVPGTLANGKACQSDAQCESGVCAKENGGCGHCAPGLTEGQSCGSEAGTTRCMIGTSCVQGTCKKPQSPRTLNEACSSDMDCASLRCESGRCAAKLAAGEACQRWSFDCAAGLTCGEAGTCVPQPKTGEPCGLGGCAPGNVCVAERCAAVKHAQPGEPCGGATLCSVGRCANGVCPVVTADGQPCTGASTCDLFASCGSSGTCELSGSRVCK